MRSEDTGKLLLRIVLGGVLLFHGFFKLTHGIGWIKSALVASSLPDFLAYGVYLGEIVAPVVIVAGFRTRVAAFVTAVDMAMAIYLALRPRIFAINEMAGSWAIETEALLLISSLALFFMGGGRFGVTRGKSSWD